VWRACCGAWRAAAGGWGERLGAVRGVEGGSGRGGGQDDGVALNLVHNAAALRCLGGRKARRAPRPASRPHPSPLPCRLLAAGSSGWTFWRWSAGS
jgi:hypothetical protein